MQLSKQSLELMSVSKKQVEMLSWFLSLTTQAKILQPLAHVKKVLIKFDKAVATYLLTRNVYLLSDSYPAFFLPIATTSNKKF